MSCERGQRYILGEDDILLPNLVTEDNKNNLSEGGLFDGIIIPDSSQNISGDFDGRTLHDSSGYATLDWETPKLNGNWQVTGDLDVTGNITGDIAADQLDWSGVNTDFIVEGDNNYYMTKPRLAEWAEDLLAAEAPIEKTVSLDPATQDTIITFSLGEELSGLIVTDKTIHVSPAGTNSRTTEDSNYDLGKPFKTVQMAAAAAVPGDLIMVWPGEYLNEFDLLKDQVNYYFHNGATIRQTIGQNTSPLFIDSSSPVTAQVRGHGSFISADPVISEVLRVSNPQSDIFFEAKEIRSTLASSINKFAVAHYNGKLKLKVDIIKSGSAGVFVGNQGHIYLKSCYVSAANGPVVELSGSAAALKFDDCQLVTAHSSSAAVYLNTAVTSTPVSFRNTILEVPRTGALHTVGTNTGNTPSVSILPGNCANKDMQRTDIIISELSPFTVDLSIETQQWDY